MKKTHDLTALFPKIGFVASIASLLMFAIGSPTSFAANVSTRIVDGLGRPVAKATVDIHWLKSFSKDDVRKMELVTLVTDRNGRAKGTYDEKSLPAGEGIWVGISKVGYGGFTATGLSSEFVLERKFGKADFPRIGNLTGRVQVQELRGLLGGDLEDSGEETADLMFIQEHRFRGALRKLVRDPKIGKNAGAALAFIGVPEDVRLFVNHAPPPKNELFENRWAYGVASAMLDPTTEKEWEFLRACATNRYDDAWVDAGAIRTLRLIASPKSKRILQEVAKANPDRANMVKAALLYIESTPTPLADADLITAGNKVAQAIKIGKWQGNQPPQFNEEGDKALIKCEFIAGRDMLIHTATFHKVGGVWKLRGVRETMQALMAVKLDSDGTAEPKK